MRRGSVVNKLILDRQVHMHNIYHNVPILEASLLQKLCALVRLVTVQVLYLCLTTIILVVFLVLMLSL